jgi:YfiH family protein
MEQRNGRPDQVTTPVTRSTEMPQNLSSTVDGDFHWVDGPVGCALCSRALGAVADHVFTTRVVSFRGETVDDDYRRLGSVFGVEGRDIIRVKQVHGRSVVVIRPGESLTDLPEADAMVSTDPSRVIAVRVADCVPILIADRGHRVVSAVHAGWRGTCAGVAGAVIAAISELEVAPDDLIAAIGPSIGGCCYQVDDRVRMTFLGVTPDAARWFSEDGPHHWRLDLWQANADQLEDAGVPPSSIHIARVCTADQLGSCFSYRREGSGTGRMVAAIRLS